MMNSALYLWRIADLGYYYRKFIQKNDALERSSLGRNEEGREERDKDTHTHDEASQCSISVKERDKRYEDKNHKVTNTNIVQLIARISSDKNNND